MRLPASVARRNSRGDSAAGKNVKKLDHRAAWFQRGASAVVDLDHFFPLFLYKTYGY